MSKTVKLSSKRQIAIPRAFCDHLGIKVGENLVIEEVQGRLIIQPKPRSYTAALKGLGQGVLKGLDPLNYIRQERAQWDKNRSPSH